MFRLRPYLYTLFALVLVGCDLPTSPQESAERVATALMKGSQEELSPLLDPQGPAAQVLASKIRIHSQGFAFRAAERGFQIQAPEEIVRTQWSIEAGIAGTDRYLETFRLTIDCREKPKRHCLVHKLEDLAPRFDELESVTQELSPDDLTPRVWLLTSLDVLDPRINLFTGRNHEVLARVETLFLDWAKKEAPAARARIAHLVNQHDLARVLLDSRTQAVFWISHGTTGKIIDSNGFELAPVWSALFSRTQASRIALISCQSKGVLPSDSRVIDFAGKIDLTDGLEEALEKTKANELLAPGVSDVQAPGGTEKITLIRKIRAFDPTSSRPALIPAIRVEVGSEIAATLPAVRSSSSELVQSLEVEVPLVAQRLILSSGENYMTPLTEIDLGQWELLSPGWKFFADAQGKPIGVTRNIVLRQRQ